MIGLLVAYVSEDDLSERRELAERIEEELQQLGEEVSAVQPLFSKIRQSYPGSLSWYRFRDIARDLDKTHGRIENRVWTFVMNVLRKGEDDTKTEDNSTS